MCTPCLTLEASFPSDCKPSPQFWTIAPCSNTAPSHRTGPTSHGPAPRHWQLCRQCGPSSPGASPSSSHAPGHSGCPAASGQDASPAPGQGAGSGSAHREPGCQHPGLTPSPTNSSAHGADRQLQAHRGPGISDLPVTRAEIPIPLSCVFHRASISVGGGRPEAARRATPVAAQQQRVSASYCATGIPTAASASWCTRGERGAATPRGCTTKFECLKSELRGGRTNRVLSCANSRISARLWYCCVLHVHAVPTSPLMPNLEQFGQFGGQKRLCKGFGSKGHPASVCQAHPPAPVNRYAHNSPACLRPYCIRMRGMGEGSGRSIAGPTTFPTALTPCKMHLRHNLARTQAVGEFTSEAS